jgi:ERCC4-related helicase
MKTSIINGSEVSRLSVAIQSTTKDKVIIFTELRDLQRELQHAIHQKFGIRPVIINGDTSTKSNSQNSRQRLIDDFQVHPGFG